MASVNHLLTDANTTASPRTTAAFTPTAGSLLMAFVFGSATSVSVGSFSTSAGTAFVKAGTSAAAGGNAHALHCFVATSAAVASSQTATFDSVGDQTTGQVIFIFEVIGANGFGTSAIQQTAKQDNVAGPSAPAPSFAASANPDNPTVGCIGIEGANPAAITEPTDWTERGDTGYGTPTTGAEYVTRDSGFSGTTITWGSSESIYCSLIVEIKAAATVTFDGSGRTKTPGGPHELLRRRLPFPAQDFTNTNIPGAVTETPTFGGATAGGNTPLAVVASTSQGANANGNSPAPTTVLSSQGATGQGVSPAPSTTLTSQGATGQGTTPAPTVSLTSQGVAGQGVNPTATATAEFTIQGATAQGQGPGAGVPPSPGGVDGSGTGPIAVVTLTSQGATGQGVSPTATATAEFTIQGALAQGNGAGATVPPDPGGAGGTGADPDAVVSLTAQGATSGGNAPTTDTGTSDTPTPGGAIAGGNEPTAVVGLNIQGATGQGVSPTATATAIFTIQGAEGSGTTPSPYVSLTAQGASGSGNAPTDSSSESVTPGGATAGGFASTSAASVDQGGSSTGSGSITAVVNLTIQGATAHGNPPDAPLQEVATPGGAISGGNSPTPDASVDFGGASTSSGGINAYITISPQGALSGGFTPTEIGVTPPTPVGPTPGSGSSKPFRLPDRRERDPDEEEALLLITLSMD